MTKWYRAGTCLLAILLVWFGVALPFFKGHLADYSQVTIGAADVQVCDPGGNDCVRGEGGRGLGGAQTAFCLCALLLALFLAIELIQAAREKVLDRLPVWTLIVIALYTITLGALFLVPDDPPGGAMHASWGFLVCLAAVVPAVVAQTNLFDNFASDEELGLVPEIPKARAIQAPALAARTPAVVATTHVTQADFGHAGLRVRTEDGAERRIEWTGLRMIALDATSDRAHLDLITRDGEALRISQTSRVDYRFLPGGVAQTELDNLRRLEQFARERNPAAG